MKLIFLDIDGVLNDHTKHQNGYSGIHLEKVAILNRILDHVPDSMIVLSSAWRYSFATSQAVETLLAIHGANVRKRVHGVTFPDEQYHDGPLPEFGNRPEWERLGLKWRRSQILHYIQKHRPESYCAIDDLPLDLMYLVKTDPSIGLTDEHVDAAIAILNAK